MKRRLVRGSAVVLLVLAMAITPLSVVFSAGRFETWLPSRDIQGPSSAHVVLDDQTGMVRGISAAHPGDLDTVVNLAGNRLVLEVTWGDSFCLREEHLGFRRSDNGYVVEQRALARNCGFLDLHSYAVAIYLWSPVDGATVTLDSE